MLSYVSDPKPIHFGEHLQSSISMSVEHSRIYGYSLSSPSFFSKLKEFFSSPLIKSKAIDFFQLIHYNICQSDCPQTQRPTGSKLKISIHLFYYF